MPTPIPSGNEVVIRKENTMELKTGDTLTVSFDAVLESQTPHEDARTISYVWAWGPEKAFKTEIVVTNAFLLTNGTDALKALALEAIVRDVDKLVSERFG